MVRGTAWDGVDVFSNGAPGAGSFPQDRVPTGLKFQCVELVQRFFHQRLGFREANWRANAKDFLRTGAELGLETYENGNSAGIQPQWGDALVFEGGTYGHVAVVTNVVDGYVHFVEQNLSATGQWKLRMNGTRVENRPLGRSTYRVIGWVRFPGIQMPAMSAETPAPPATTAVPTTSSAQPSDPILIITGGSCLFPSTTECSGSQGTTFSFRGGGLTPNGIATLRVEPPTRSAFESEFRISSDGSVTWQYTTKCTDEPGLYSLQLRDKTTGLQTNRIFERIGASPACRGTNPDRPPTARLQACVKSRCIEENQVLQASIAGATVQVEFSARRSIDNEGELAGYRWYINGTSVSDQRDFRFDLGPGTHQIFLTVTDSLGNEGSVGATIEVTSG